MCISADCSLADKSPMKYVNMWGTHSCCSTTWAEIWCWSQRRQSPAGSALLLQSSASLKAQVLKDQCQEYFGKATHSTQKSPLVSCLCLLWPPQVHPTHRRCCQLHLLPEHWTALRKRRQRRKSMAWALKEVFHQSGASCPRANQQSPSWPQHKTVHSGNSAVELSPSLWEISSKTVHNRSLNNTAIFPLPTLLCVPVLAR